MFLRTDSPGRWLIAMFLLVVAVYLPSVQSEFIYDDLEVILNHKAPSSLSDVAQIFRERHYPALPYYRPVTRASLLLQKTIHGDNPALFHLANTLLAGVAAWIVYLFLRLPALEIGMFPALMGATLFAVHPAVSSCVYPICSGRETLLPACLIVSAVFAFLHGGRNWYVAALVCFAAALFAKEQSVIVPVLFVLGDLLRLSPDSPGLKWGDWFRRYWPLPIPLLLYFGVRWTLFEGTEYKFAVLDAPAGPWLSFGYALQTTFAPSFALVYEPTADIWLSAIRLPIAVAALLVLVTADFRLRSELRRPALFWFGWFVVSLLPTANLLEQEAKYSERYVALSLLAVVGLGAGVATAVWERRIARRSIVTAGLLLIAAAVTVSWHRGGYYQDQLAFFRQWVQTDPQKILAHVNFGNALQDEGHLDAAIEQFRAAIQLDSNWVTAHINLGNVLADQGQFDEAANHYELALQCPNVQPHLAGIHLNFGSLMAKQRKFDEAIGHFYKSLEYDPDLVGTYIMLGNVFAGQRKFDLAINQFRHALQLVPNSDVRFPKIQKALRYCQQQQQSLRPFQ